MVIETYLLEGLGCSGEELERLRDSMVRAAVFKKLLFVRLRDRLLVLLIKIIIKRGNCIYLSEGKGFAGAPDGVAGCTKIL